MKLGVIVNLNKDINQEFKKLRDIGFETCQLCCWNKEMFTDEYAELVKAASKEHKIEITGLWCGWQQPAIWNFYDGPVTLGIVPPTYRFARTETLIQGSDFAKKINVTDVITHIGFIPENPNDPEYRGIINAVKHIARHCNKNHQYFLFETGQETPITLKRLIQDCGIDNLGINLDPANLLMYGKGNPIDALDVFGEYVRGVHAKDGEYPIDGRELGMEKPVGQGRVNFPMLLSKLKAVGYKGALTIEREISGEGQIKDIIEAKKLLEKLI